MNFAEYYDGVKVESKKIAGGVMMTQPACSENR